MTSEHGVPAADPHHRAWSIFVAASVVVLLALAYAGWAAYLFVFASEGSLPPRWRAPDLPAGAEVVGETTDCASGGCWRELLVRPATGQSPARLSAELGVTSDVELGWHLLDPHAVSVGSNVAGSNLVLRLQYRTVP